jgi:hypothetical protein
MGSNGLTSARHDVLAHSLAAKVSFFFPLIKIIPDFLSLFFVYRCQYPESFDPQLLSQHKNLVYCGSQELTAPAPDLPSGVNMT